MGRHQIIGNEFCPIHTCHSLGRYRIKKIKNRKDGRYVNFYYFRHNDKNIPEHYVDNYIRRNQTELLQVHPLGEFIKLLKESANEFDKTAFHTQKISQQIKNLPLTDKEALDLKNGVKQKTEIVTALSKIMKLLKVGLTLRLEGKEVPEWLQVEEHRLIGLAQNLNERTTAIDKLVSENPRKAIRKSIKILKSDPYNIALSSIYEKYVFPERLKRYKFAGKKNSRWN